MLPKSKIQTTLFNGLRLLANRQNRSFLNFKTESVARANAEKYSALLGQKVTVTPHIVNGETLCFNLSVNEFIA